ncbi:pentapeptide repeat-containing protein [Streptomyces sp. 8K308]|uniref:pentapeptide repeat-containing protein n=1 Tax=Streptomyces sp. 8K308 TaxID=2530388 RepID=UPI001FB7B28B|nr:pentapeptide repeat-containing protein [Streptomyces sp. 8K308]
MPKPRKAVRPPTPPNFRLPELRSFAEPGGLEPEGDYDALEFADLDLTGAEAPSATFLECALRRCVLNEANLRHARLLDGVLDAPRGVGTLLADAQLRDLEITDARLGGVQLSGATLTRVRVRGGKIDYLNLRQAKLVDVAFEGCVLVEPDFGGARLERVSFEGCELRGADLTAAELRDVDLRGTTLLDLTRGIDRLRGAVITPSQLLDLAPRLAAELGLRVEG